MLLLSGSWHSPSLCDDGCVYMFFCVAQGYLIQKPPEGCDSYSLFLYGLSLLHVQMSACPLCPHPQTAINSPVYSEALLSHRMISRFVVSQRIHPTRATARLRHKNESHKIGQPMRVRWFSPNKAMPAWPSDIVVCMLVIHLAFKKTRGEGILEMM